MIRRLPLQPRMRPIGIASRVLAAVVGGWVFVWGCTTLAIAALLIGGLSYADARTLVHLLAFLVYLGAFCWSFATPSTLRAWIVLAGGGSAMTALAWWLTRPPT